MSNRRKITPEIESQILTDFLGDEKMTATKAAPKYGCSISAICLTLKRNNFKLSKLRLSKLSIQDEKQLIGEYESGASNESLAKKYELCTASILNIVKKHNGKRKLEGGQKVFTCDESFFEKIDTHEKAQVLGFLYADGNITTQRNIPGAWRAEIQYRDEEILTQIANYIGYNGKFQYKILNKRKYVKLAVSRKKMAEDLINAGCMINKTYKIRFPYFLKEDLLASFLYGYWLGDGWASFSNKRHNYYFAVIGNEEFIMECKEFIESKLGIKCSLDKKKNNPKIITLRFYSKNSIKFWDFISQNIKLVLNRKINKANAIKDYSINKTISEELLKPQKNTEFYSE